MTPGVDETRTRDKESERRQSTINPEDASITESTSTKPIQVTT